MVALIYQKKKKKNDNYCSQINKNMGVILRTRFIRVTFD